MGRIAKVTDELSDEGRRVMMRGFANARPAAAIAVLILEATGETVSPRTVSRRAAEWRAEMSARTAARERMADLVEAMKSGGMEASEMVQALAMDHLVEHPDALTKADPIQVQTLSLKGEELRLKRHQLVVRERALVLMEKRAELLAAREERAIAALGDDKVAMTAEERVQQIREIYGIRS